ncbi:hypothetical protein BMS3Abin02_00539 [bacterium BMS3Abin02]|nr:hypothetical protein BMS3Abin02_00539 [bacterium BMS3Abin02]GBE23004.1 hypothetical protein BMS3Bbin01_02383 [bacterium BMS3Bbin01]HDH26527.1 hypothetical protein [Actinomycetota bacterium]
MNRLSGDRGTRKPTSIWMLWAWLMVVLGGVSIAAGIVGGILAPSVILDVVSFWPLLAPVVLVSAALLLWRRTGTSRLGAISPMLLITVLGAAVSLHLLGWSRLPSAAADLTGPGPDAASIVSLKVDLPGRLVLGSGEGALYTIKLDREGGRLGVPEALERGGGEETMFIEVRQRDGGRWFRTNGWTIRLAPQPTWELSLASPDLTVDLRSLDVRSAEFSGSGSVLLGSRGEGMIVVVSGSVVVEVPADALVEVKGAATVPGGWETTSDGYRSTGQGTAIEISVTDGSRAVIKQR